MQIPQNATPSTDLFNLANDAGRLVAASIALVSEGQGGKLAAIAAGVNGDLAHQPIESLLFEACKQVATEKGDSANLADVITAASAAASADGGEWQGSPTQRRLIDAVAYLRHLVGVDLEREAKLFAGRLSEERAKREAKNLLRSGLDDLESGSTAGLLGIAEKLEAITAAGASAPTTVGGDDLEAAYFQSEQRKPIPTGLAWFDSKYDGIAPGVTVIAGRPGSAKSAMAMNLAVGAMRTSGVKVIWGMGELTVPMLVERMTAALFADGSQGPKVSMNELFNRFDTGTDAVKAALTHFKDQFLIETDFSLAAIEAAILRHKPDLVVLDYFQLLENPDPKVDQLQHLQKSAQQIVRLADRHGVSIIAVSSIASDTVKSARDRPPIGSVTSDSKKLDYGATQYFVHKELSTGCPHESTSSRRLQEWQCIKNRIGEQKDLTLLFDGTFHNFVAAVTDDAGKPVPIETFDEFGNWGNY